MPVSEITRLLTRKNAPAESRIDRCGAGAPLQDGEVLLQLERFALTTNNITYAAFGEAMDYWRFFPTHEEGWGHMPVWGYGRAVASRAPGIEPGERFYGYFPIASHLRMQAVRVTERGFYDGAGHRQGLPSPYNQYTRCRTDPAYAEDLADYQMLFKPLFFTSFLLADFLQDNGLFGARRVLVSSASSKTAYGTAYCLQERTDIELVGLTSERNRDFVAGLGVYARVAGYHELESLATDRPTLYVDFSGDESLRRRIHEHFGAALRYDCFVGSAANTDFLRDTGVPGPAPEFFFAPAQIKKRNRDWGPEVLSERYNEAQRLFIAAASAPDNPWIRLVTDQGFEAAGRVIAELVESGGDPAQGHVIEV